MQQSRLPERPQSVLHLWAAMNTLEIGYRGTRNAFSLPNQTGSDPRGLAVLCPFLLLVTANRFAGTLSEKPRTETQDTLSALDFRKLYSNFADGRKGFSARRNKNIFKNTGTVLACSPYYVKMKVFCALGASSCHDSHV